MIDLQRFAHGATLALFLSAAGASAELRSGASEPFELKVSDPSLEGKGPSLELNYTAAHDGSTFIYAVSDSLDLFLRVESVDGDGKKLGEDDNSGGGTTPAVVVEVTAGQKLKVIVAASKPNTSGRGELHVFDGIETPATRDAVVKAQLALKTIDELGKKGDVDGARKLLPPTLDAILATQGALDSPALLNELKPLAVFAYYAHDYALAEKALLPLLALLERALPPGAPDTLGVKGNLAIMLKMEGKLHEALPIEEDLLFSLSKALPEDHPQLQKVRINLARTRKELGDLRGALELEEKAVASLKRAGADASFQTTAASNLAVTRYQLGDLPSARALQQEVLKFWEDSGKADSDEGLRARANLSLTLRDLGDLDQARAIDESVLEARSRSLPEDDRERLSSMGNLAQTLARLGKIEDAKKLEEKVLTIRERTLPDDHEEVQYARTNLGQRLFDLGDFASALKLQEKVLEVRTRTLPPYHSRLLTARGNVALTLDALGELTRARELFAEVYAAASQTLPDESPDLEEARSHHAWALARLGERDQVKPLILELCRGVRRRLDLLELSLSPREVEAIALGAEPGVSDVLSLTQVTDASGQFPELEAEAFALVERLRGAALTGSLLARAFGAGSSLPPEVERLRAGLTEATREIARLAQGSAESKETREKLLAAIRRRDEIYRDLRGKINSFPGSGGALLETDTSSIARALKSGEAAVAFRRYMRQEIDPTTHKKKPPVAHYLAHVLRRDTPLRRVDLGPAETIEKAIALWRQSEAVDAIDSRGIDLVTGTPRPRVESAGEGLRQLVLDPLRSSLGDARGIVVALDGALHLVPIDALPEERGLVGERLLITHRSALKELTMKPPLASKSTTLLLVGGIDFDLKPDAPDPTILAALTRGAPVDRAGAAGRAGTFRPLPGTWRELDSIAQAFREAFPKEATLTALRGGEATREAFEKDAPGARYVHISTHGYFAPESLRSIADGAGGTASGFAPLTLAGLAFAGANQPPDRSGRVSGILTAEELTAVDLRGCELVVLSACDTGVGLSRAGQSVASLELSVRAAGARSAIASIWKVPDEASRELMSAFYRRLWKDRKPKAKALWESKLELRSRRNARGEPVYALRDWAAWVLVGEAD